MSSFRPQQEGPPPIFVPQALGPALASGFGSDPIASSQVAESMDAATAEAAIQTVSESDPQADIPAPNPAFEEGAAEETPPSIDVEALERAAYERGRAEALPDAEAIDRAAAAMERAAEQWRVAADACLSAHRTWALDLCRDVVERWVGEELAHSPERYAEMLKGAREICAAADTPRIHVSAEDLAALEAGLPERLATWQNEMDLELVADATLESGDFRIDGAGVSLDGRRSVVAARLRAHWEAARADAEGAPS